MYSGNDNPLLSDSIGVDEESTSPFPPFHWPEAATEAPSRLQSLFQPPGVWGVVPVGRFAVITAGSGRLIPRECRLNLPHLQPAPRSLTCPPVYWPRGALWSVTDTYPVFTSALSSDILIFLAFCRSCWYITEHNRVSRWPFISFT